MCIPRSAITIAMVVLFAGGILATSGHAEVSMDNVVALWLFDEEDGDVAIDSSGNGHDGTMAGDPERIDGMFGGALEFDGLDDFIGCGNDAALDIGVFSIAFWAKMPATQGWNHIITRGSHGAKGVPGSVNWTVMAKSGASQFLFEMYRDVDWNGQSTNIVLDTWQHVVGTYDGDKMELFINAEPRRTDAGIILTLDESREFRLAGGSTVDAKPNNYFNGSIDEIAYFDVVLSTDDMQEIMDTGLVESLNIVFAVSPGGKVAATWAKIKAE